MGRQGGLAAAGARPWDACRDAWIAGTSIGIIFFVQPVRHVEHVDLLRTVVMRKEAVVVTKGYDITYLLVEARPRLLAYAGAR